MDEHTVDGNKIDEHVVEVSASCRDVASALDEARQRVADLEVRGYHPAVVSVSPALYDQIYREKRNEAERFGQIYILGMRLERASDGA